MLYLKGMRLMMFQLSGFYCRVSGTWVYGLRIFMLGLGVGIRVPKP